MTDTNNRAPRALFFRPVDNRGGDLVGQECTMQESREFGGVDRPLHRSHFISLPRGTATVVIIFRRMLIEHHTSTWDENGQPNCFCVMPEWNRGADAPPLCPAEFYSSMHAAREAVQLMVNRIELDSIASTYKNELKKMSAEDDSLSSKRRVLDI